MRAREPSCHAKVHAYKCWIVFHCEKRAFCASKSWKPHRAMGKIISLVAHRFAEVILCMGLNVFLTIFLNFFTLLCDCMRAVRVMWCKIGHGDRRHARNHSQRRHRRWPRCYIPPYVQQHDRHADGGLRTSVATSSFITPRTLFFVRVLPIHFL